MAFNETTVTMIGTVLTDVEPRRTVEGTKVLNFRLVSTERRYDKAAGEWVDGDKLIVTVNCWDTLAAGAAASLGKGDPVVVTGRLSVRQYDLDGTRRTATEIRARAIGPDLARCTAQVVRNSRAAPPAEVAA